MNRDEYNHLEGIRRSNLIHMKKSPKHYHYNLSVGFKKTDAKEFGIMFHCFLLEPERFKLLYGEFDKSNMPEPKRSVALTVNSEWIINEKEKLIDLNQQPYTPGQYIDMEQMRDSILEDDEARDLLFLSGQFENAFTWTDEDTGLKCKCLVDKDIPSIDSLVELKTCKDASPSGFMRDASNMDYEFQPAYYLDGTGRKNMIYICVEKESPFACNVFHPDPDEYIYYGRLDYKYCLKAVKDCTDKGKWPGYSYWKPRGGNILELPPWKKRAS